MLEAAHSRRRLLDGLTTAAARLRRPEVLTALLCAVLIVADVRGQDLPAQEYRAWLFHAHGVVLWNDQWYSGHLVPGYSVLFPPLAAAFGVRLVLAVSCVAATALAARLFGDSRSGRVASWWFAVASASDLLVGRGPFALGVVLGLGAVLATRDRRPGWAAAAALASSLASPLAGAFVLLAGVAWAVEIGVRRAAPLAASLGGIAVAAVLGGSGVFPFPLSTLAAVLAFVAVGLALAPRSARAVRVGLLLYGAAALVCFAVPNPVGGNLARIGALMAGPLAVAVLLRHHRAALVAVIAPLLWWQVMPVASALAVQGDPSADPAYYRPLLTWLAAHTGPADRLEIPFTRNHWESYYVARAHPLARGWDRQLDVQDNAVLYRPLTAAAYREWLLDNAVTVVALPDAPLDPSGKSEAAVLAHPPRWLRPVLHTAHWRVWRVVDPEPMVSPPGRLLALGVDSVVLRLDRPSAVVLRVRWNPFWTAPKGVLVSGTPDGWTAVASNHAGTVTLTSQFSLGGLAR